ncbi:MAG: DUF951 domain-containing protein [Peptococcaceae bacterium]|nr:DUF951 domain-containing protein [Peptococcaceae bacterium]
MSQLVKYKAGDVVKMKKTHPCGGDIWEIMRIGIDFRIKCQKCGRVIMIPRPKFEKSVRSIVSTAAPGKPES